MRLLSLLKKIVIIIRKHKDTNFTIQKQEEILNMLPEPKDNYERSYFQYRCQNKKMGFIFVLLSNVTGFFLFIIFYFKLGFNKTSKSSSKCKAVFLSNDISKNILPNSLKEEFEEIMYMHSFDSLVITSDDRKYIIKLWKKYPYSFYFLYKCMMKIAIYSAKIQIYNPSAIITYSEFSFTSSILTNYCNINNVEHINVMHGEKVFDIIDSFFKFNRCYVWDEFYKNLFIELRAYDNQFIVEVPPSLNMDLNCNINPIYDFTYYLADENEVQLKRIRNCFEILKSKNKTVSVRPHPRYSNIRLVNKIFNEFFIEDFINISIKESLERTNGLISLNSTVLLQGSYNNKVVIIDDMTSKENYNKLYEVKYIMLTRPHKLLSQIM